MWEEIVFVVVVILVIVLLFAFGLKLKARELADLEKYFRPKHG